MKNKRVVLLRSNPVNPDPPVEKMAETLLENGYDVTIVGWDRESEVYLKEIRATHSSGLKFKIVRFGIPAVYGGGLKKTLKPFLKFQKYLKRWLKNNKDEYDIIHAFDFDTGYVAKKAAKKYKKKLIYHILDFYVDSHASGGKLLRRIIKKLEFSVIKTADTTIVCTEKRLEQIKGSKPKKVAIIHNTPNQKQDKLSELKIEKNSRLKIAYIGIFGEGRLLNELLQTVAEDKDIELHIGGFGLLEEKIKKYSEENENIFYYGKLPYCDTLALEEQCDIMTAIYDPSVPNHRFAAPNKFYEAMMLGKPLIMVKNTGFDELIDDKKLGVLIDYTQEGLKEGLVSLKQNKQTGGEIGSRNRAIYEESFSWQMMEERILDLYKTL